MSVRLKLLAIWLGCVVCVAPAFAFWQSRDSGYNVSVGGGGGGGNVTADVVGTTKYQRTSNNFNYTGLTITAALTNPGLVCFLVRADGVNDVEAGIAVTWNGSAMALRKLQDAGPADSAVFLFGKRNPTSGAQTLNVSATNTATDNFVNCVSFSNVNQTSDALAFPNPTGNVSAASLSVTSAAGHIAAGVFFNSGASVGTIIGTTVMNDASSGLIANAGADYVASSGASTNIGSSLTQTVIAGMDISN